MKGKAQGYQDVQLWQAFKVGCSQAFEVIYTGYYPVLRQYGRKFTADTSLIDDCIQDLFAELLDKRQRLSNTDSIRFYLYRGLQRRIFRRLQTDNRLGYRVDLDELGDQDWFSGSDYEAYQLELARMNQLLTLQQAISTLPERQQEVLRLRFSCKLTNSAIATQMAIDVNSVYKLVWVALKALRRQISSGPN